MSTEYPTKTARMGAVLALISTLIWVQWPMDFTQVGVAPAIAFVGAFLVWVSVEWADWQNHHGYNINVLDEDVRKLNELIEMVDRKTYYILRNCNVETYINSDDYRGLEDLISYYEEDVFPFYSQKLQESYEDFQSKSRKFLNDLWTLYTSDGSGRATWRPGGDGWVSQEHYERVMSKIGILNRQTTELSRAWENLIQVAKIELRGNSIGIASYSS